MREYITPLVTPGSSLQQLSTGLRPDGTADANGGISTALSPDGKTLLVLASGYNTGFMTTAGTTITVPYLNADRNRIDGTSGAIDDVSAGVRLRREPDTARAASADRLDEQLPRHRLGSARHALLCLRRLRRPDLYLQAEPARLVNVDRTMEDLLGMDHLGINDANAASMDDVFSIQPDLQPYNVLIPGSLCEPPVHPDLVPDCFNPQMQSRKTRAVRPLHDGRWWGAHTKNLSFKTPDANDAGAYSRLLWRGIVGDNAAYPEERSGLDLSQNRAAVLETVKSPLDSAR